MKEAHSLIQVFYHETIHRQPLKETLKMIKNTWKIHSICNTGTPGIPRKGTCHAVAVTVCTILECLFKAYADN